MPGEDEGWPGLGSELHDEDEESRRGKSEMMPDESDGEDGSEVKVKRENEVGVNREDEVVMVKEEDKGAQSGLRRGKRLRRIAPPKW